MTGSKYWQTQRNHLLLAPFMWELIRISSHCWLLGAFFTLPRKPRIWKVPKPCPSGRECANWGASLSLQPTLRKRLLQYIVFAPTIYPGNNLCSLDFTCRTKCLCLPSSRCKSSLSKWDLNNDRYSFWRLMSVASIKAPIWVSICCLELEK